MNAVVDPVVTAAIEKYKQELWTKIVDVIYSRRDSSDLWIGGTIAERLKEDIREEMFGPLPLEPKPKQR